MRITTEVSTTFAQRLRNEESRVFLAFQVLGVSHKSISNAIGRSEPTISFWARGQKPIPPEYLQQLIQLGRDQCRAAAELAKQFAHGTGVEAFATLRDVRLAEQLLDEVEVAA
ncbi:MAG: helix-turn-helix domain-containing protein [Gammaproteobacteria bacterium]|nr:helix-turn-helix domain-containing protein [Gammaproteobacteria bacterium]MBU1407286.1 helix-turn-helix domain-containing protein [Gammaproteobacteria bacterium]MBU1531340.1 helix-turn-helix domain-containing protein [Gammaproteobacteria bacterium]